MIILTEKTNITPENGREVLANSVKMIKACTDEVEYFMYETVKELPNRTLAVEDCDTVLWEGRVRCVNRMMIKNFELYVELDDEYVGFGELGITDQLALADKYIK